MEDYDYDYETLQEFQRIDLYACDSFIVSKKN